MRIIVSGGGTGGHIYPALTIVRAIQKKIPDAEFLYVGTKDGLEADIVPKEGIPFETVNIQGFKRSLTPENLVRGAQAFGGVVKAMSIVRRFKPDVAVGTRHPDVEVKVKPRGVLPRKVDDPRGLEGHSHYARGSAAHRGDRRDGLEPPDDSVGRCGEHRGGNDSCD